MNHYLTPKERIEDTIKKFFRALDTQDFELMEQVIAKKENMVHIGTDTDEIWRGWSELNEATEEQFKNLEFYKATIRGLSIHISNSGNVAWYSHLLDAEIKSTTSIQHWRCARFTGVLEKAGDHWEIVQTHVSIPESHTV